MASDQNSASPSAAQPARPRLRVGKRLAAGVGVIVILAVGAGVGAAAVGLHGHNDLFVPATVGPVSGMKDWASVTIKGNVAEIFGNKFVLQDESGRALVETGPAGEDGDLVAKDEAVTVEGRFEHGFVHAVALIHADGKSVEVGPPHGPAPGPGPAGWLRHLHTP